MRSGNRDVMGAAKSVQNSTLNSGWQGFVAPSTYPNGAEAGNNAGGPISAVISAVTTENGEPVLDFRISGTSVTNKFFWFSGTMSPVGSFPQGTPVCIQYDMRIVAGSKTNFTWGTSWYNTMDAAGVQVGGGGDAQSSGDWFFRVTGAFREMYCNGSAAEALASRMQWGFGGGWSADGLPVDLTLRLRRPMVTKGKYPQPYVATDAAPATLAFGISGIKNHLG